MRTYTIKGGEARPGLPVVRDRLASGSWGAPYIPVGEDGRGRNLVRVPIPEGAQVEWTPEPPTDHWAGALLATRASEAGAILLVRDHSGFRGSWRVRSARTSEEWATIVAQDADHEAARVRAVAIPVVYSRDAGDEARAEYERALEAAWAPHAESGECGACVRPAERPAPWRVIAEGASAQGAAGRMGGGPEYLAVLPDGEAVEIVRSGRLYGAPSVVRVEARDGEVSVSDPRAEAETAAAGRAW